MSNQTENYIILKPLAERFNNVAQEITDSELKDIIKDSIREQIKGIFDFDILSELTEEYIDNHQADITNMIANSIKERLKFK